MRTNYSCAVSRAERVQGQVALSWKGTGEMSQAAEARDRTAQQL